MHAALRSYRVIMPFLSEVATMATVDESASKARGLLSQFEDGQTMLASLTAHHVFGVTDDLSCALQSSTATVYCNMEAVLHSLAQLRNMRSDDFFLKVWQDTKSKISDFGLREMKLPRHVRPPKRFDQQCTTAPAHKFTSPRRITSESSITLSLMV